MRFQALWFSTRPTSYLQSEFSGPLYVILVWPQGKSLRSQLLMISNESAGSLLAAPWQVVLVWMGDEFYLNLYLSWCNWCWLRLYERANEVPSLTLSLIWWKVRFWNFTKSVTLVPWKLGAGWPWPLWHSVGRSVVLVRIHQLGGAHHHNWFIELLWRDEPSVDFSQQAFTVPWWHHV